MNWYSWFMYDLRANSYVQDTNVHRDDHTFMIIVKQQIRLILPRSDESLYSTPAESLTNPIEIESRKVGEKDVT